MKRTKHWLFDARPWCASLSAVVAVSAVVVSSALATPPVGPLLTAAAGQGGTGTIKGRLVWGGDKAPESKVLQPKGKAQKDPEVCAQAQAIVSKALVVDPKSKGIRFAFAYLVRPSGSNPEALKALVAKNPQVEIDQKNCEFVPHAVALAQDQTLVFKSSDAASHNIHYTPFTNAALNQMLPPKAKMQAKLVAEKRPIRLSCDIHPWMEGYFMVFDHPFFAVTSEDGSFEIKGVPAGAQKLVVWQEKVGYASPGAGGGMVVTVKPGETADAGEIKLDPAKVKN